MITFGVTRVGATLPALSIDVDRVISVEAAGINGWSILTLEDGSFTIFESPEEVTHRMEAAIRAEEPVEDPLTIPAPTIPVELAVPPRGSKTDEQHLRRQRAIGLTVLLIVFLVGIAAGGIAMKMFLLGHP